MAHRDLVSGIQKGDRDSFNDLCEEVLPALMAYARAILPDEWADDAVQDVLSRSGRIVKVWIREGQC